MRYKISILIFILIISGAGCLFLAAFKAQAYKQAIAEWWVVNVYQFKGAVSQGINTKKIMFVSGSNSLFSIDSSIVESKIGLPVVNLATHAGLDLNYHYFIIRKYMKKGDIVVMPLEYSYYSATGNPTDWFVNNMTSWGQDYVFSLSPYDLLNFLSKITLKTIINGLTASKTDKISSFSEVQERIGSTKGEFNGYSYKSLNKYGDINRFTNERTVIDKIKNTPIDYGTNIKSISPYALKTLSSIKKFVEKNGGQLIITWPVTMRDSLFDTNSPNTIKTLSNIKLKLHENGFDMRCSPTMTNLGSEFFMDSIYHTNGYGAVIRTTLLADCLKAILSNDKNYDEDKNYRNVVLSMEKQTPYYK